MKFNENLKYTLIAQDQDPTDPPRAVFTDEASEYIVQQRGVAQSRRFEFRLTISRSDKQPIRSWRVLQDIKNEIVGESRYAIEVYPPEAEVTDTANLYHLWVYLEGEDPGVRLTPPR
jgi:hypothetical protein